MKKEVFNKFASIILLVSIFISFMSFRGNVAFGHGLGDIVDLLLLWGSTLGFLICFVKYRKYKEKLFITNMIFTLLFFWLFLEMTFWRGSEYPWNGEIFIN